MGFLKIIYHRRLKLNGFEGIISVKRFIVLLLILKSVDKIRWKKNIINNNNIS